MKVRPNTFAAGFRPAQFLAVVRANADAPTCATIKKVMDNQKSSSSSRFFVVSSRFFPQQPCVLPCLFETDSGNECDYGTNGARVLGAPISASRHSDWGNVVRHVRSGGELDSGQPRLEGDGTAFVHGGVVAHCHHLWPASGRFWDHSGRIGFCCRVVHADGKRPRSERVSARESGMDAAHRTRFFAAVCAAYVHFSPPLGPHNRVRA
jgi:hypothetical protein